MFVIPCMFLPLTNHVRDETDVPPQCTLCYGLVVSFAR